MSHLVRTSIPKLHRDWTIKDLMGASNISEIQNKVAKYLSDSSILDEGNNLYIYSNSNGTGKSRIANYILALLHEPRFVNEIPQIIPIASVDFGEYLGLCSNQFDEAAIAARKTVMTVPILLLDDVSPAFCSNNLHKDKRELILLMKYRREDMRITIITSNLIPSEFNTTFGMTAASKVLENFSYIEVKGEDVRDVIYPDKLEDLPQ